MKAYIKALVVQILPDVQAIPYILFALIPVIFLYFIFSCRKASTSFVAMLIVLQLMTPIAYYPIANIKGLQPVYLWWLTTLLVVTISRVSSGQSLELMKFFRLPLIFLLAVQLLAWLNTFFASSDHPFYQAGFTRAQLFFGYFLNPIQIVLSAWMVMLVSEDKNDMALIQRAIMIAAIIFGSLIAIIYLKTGAQSGSSEQLFIGRFSINEIMGEENNGIAAICVFLFIACMCMKNHNSQLLNLSSIGAIAAGILYTLSRMAWINTGIVILLLVPKMKWVTRIFILLVLYGLYLHSHTIIINRLAYGIDKQYSSRIERLDNIAANRITIWQNAWKQIQGNILLGTGIQTGVFLKDGSLAYHPHNAYIRVLLDMGILGILAVIVSYGYMLFISFKKSGLLLFAIISLFIMGFMALEFHPHKQNYLIWIFYAMTLNETQSLKESEERSQPISP